MNRNLTAALACAALLPLAMVACGPKTAAPADDAAATAPVDAGVITAPTTDISVPDAAVQPAMPVSQLCASGVPAKPDVSGSDFTELAGGLKIKDVVEGTGPEVKAGMISAIHYAGFLEDGTPFDSSCKSGQPYPSDLVSGVIDGWLQGIPGMKVGGRRILVIPAALGYGEMGSPPVIPPNATLIFEVEAMSSQ